MEQQNDESTLTSSLLILNNHCILEISKYLGLYEVNDLLIQLAEKDLMEELDLKFPHWDELTFDILKRSKRQSLIIVFDLWMHSCVENEKGIFNDLDYLCKRILTAINHCVAETVLR